MSEISILFLKYKISKMEKSNLVKKCRMRCGVEQDSTLILQIRKASPTVNAVHTSKKKLMPRALPRTTAYMMLAQLAGNMLNTSSALTNISDLFS